MNEKEHEKDATITLAHQILAKAHPDGATVIKHWITIIQARWDEVSTWARQVSLPRDIDVGFEGSSGLSKCTFTDLYSIYKTA